MSFKVREPIDIENLYDQMTNKDISEFVKAVKWGDRLADRVMEENVILDWALGANVRGQIRAVAISFALQKSVTEGRLSFKSSIEVTKTGGYRYVLFSTANAKFTISQVKSKKDTARQAFFRDKLIEGNQLYFVFEDEVINDEDIHYFLVTYNTKGSNQLFINFGVPKADGGWMCAIDLLEIPHVVEQDDQDSEEEITPEDLVLFRTFGHEVMGDEA
jgi:hypothetical protein